MLNQRLTSAINQHNAFLRQQQIENQRTLEEASCSFFLSLSLSLSLSIYLSQPGAL